MESLPKYPLIAPNNSRFYVSNKYESLDYDRLDSEVLIEEEEIRGKRFMTSIIIERVLLFILVGIITGIAGTAIEIGTYYGSLVRYSFLFDATNTYLDTNFPKLCILWAISIFVPSFVAAVLVAYGEPLAQGGGTHLVLCYLNGVNLRKYIKFKIVVIKVLSVILTASSGLPAGKEAPMVNIGATTGCLAPLMSLGNFQPFNFFHQDPERRDLASAGAAAGFTAAFGTPIAGIMVAFEESLTFWKTELTFLIFISALSSFFTLKFLVNTIMMDCIDCVASKENLFLEGMVDKDKTYFIYELPMFVLFGVIGGVLGAIWNMLQDQLIFFRKRFVNTPAKKLFEVFLVMIVNGMIQISMVKYFDDYCVHHHGKKSLPEEDRYKPSQIRLKCKEENEFSASGLFFFQNGGAVFRSLFTEKESPIGVSPLIMFCLYYYFGSCLLMGCQLAHGIFVPHIVIGNVWGRAIAEWINIMNPDSKSWARPNKFAFLCGAAQLCGTLRITFTICVMMLEACNNVSLGIPIFIVVFTSRFIGNLINLPILIRVCSYAGIPVLEKEPPPFLSHIKIKDILKADPVVTLPMELTYAAVKEVLSSNSHSAFPIVASRVSGNIENNLRSYGALKGIILRTQIKALLKHHKTIDKEDWNVKNTMGVLRREYASILVNQPVEVSKNEENNIINFSSYMNRTPYFVQMDCSLPHAYRMFSGLGMRHLIVVNSGYEVVGIITRKDLSVYRFFRYGFHLDVVKLPIRDN